MKARTKSGNSGKGPQQGRKSSWKAIESRGLGEMIRKKSDKDEKSPIKREMCNLSHPRE